MRIEDLIKKYRAMEKGQPAKKVSDVDTSPIQPENDPFKAGYWHALHGWTLEQGLGVLMRSAIKNKDPEQYTAGYNSVKPEDRGSKLLRY